MVSTSCVIVLSCLGLSASHHFEWDNYHWGQQNQDSQNHPGPAEYDEQDGQRQGPYQQEPENQNPYEQSHQQDQPSHGSYPEGQQSQGYQQNQQNYEIYQGSQQNQGLQQSQNNDHVQGDQFPGYRPSNRPLSTLPSLTTPPPSTTQITPVPNSVPKEIPKHRLLLRQLYQQVLGPNFTDPALQQLAFLSSGPSLPLKSQVQDYPQPQVAETQYDLPQYIEPPLPPHYTDQFNYYS